MMKKELTDYRGEFDPDIKYGDFSKDLLVELLNAYSGYTLRVNSLWYLGVRQAMGEDEAFFYDTRIWEKMTIHELDMTCRLFKVEGNDVATMMKAMQLSPWMGIYRYNIELRSPSDGILTITECPTLLALEREGAGREERTCREIESKRFRVIADFFNPEIKVQPLRLPPRKGKDEVCCQWEFRLDV